jgi:hypothetical protein
LAAPFRSLAIAGAWRRAGPCALGLAALALPCATQAQFVGTLGIESVDRYRGSGTDDVGPVVRASVMADSAAGAYAGVAGLWRTRDAGLASADALLGWSGRLATLAPLAALSPDWGWDAAVHRAHYGEGSHRDFSELMLGLLAPGWTLRSWYAPHYFGGDAHTLYTELDASHSFDERWHVFGHVGRLHYGSESPYRAHPADRTDAMAGIDCTLGRWDLRVSHDGIVAGHAPTGLEARRRRAAWILGASVAF